jgi:hypothetical protein
MELFREEYLTIQDDYLRVDPSREESDTDDDVDYSNDDLGENTEITPLGEEVEVEDINDLRIGPGDDDDFAGDDVDIDVDDEELDEEDDFVDMSAQIDPDDDFEDDDDDLLDDDDDLDATIAPDLDDDDDFVDDDDDLLSDDDDDDFDDETTARTSDTTEADFSSRPHGRVTGTMIDHEPGLPGSNRS